MAVTAAKVKAIATEFATYDEQLIDFWVALAEQRTNRTEWDALADTAVIFLTAHFLKCYSQQSGASVGPVLSESVGQLSRTYANSLTSAQSRDFLGSTHWGRMYLELLSTIFVTRVYV